MSDWFSKSKSTEPCLEECEHSGCQVVNKTVENVDQVKKLVFESRRIAVEMSKFWEFHWIVGRQSDIASLCLPTLSHALSVCGFLA